MRNLLYRTLAKSSSRQVGLDIYLNVGFHARQMFYEDFSLKIIDFWLLTGC